MTLPNIIYMHSHDTGRHIQPYGYPVPTPRLSELAADGVLFRKAFSAAPTCSPSRAALLTGQCAHSSGMIGLAHLGFSLKEREQHIVHTLRKAGYTSTLIGLQHVAKKEDESLIGYDSIIPVESRTADHVPYTAEAFLDNPPTQPFFLDIGLSETHREFPDVDESEGRKNHMPFAVLPDTLETRLDVAAFKQSAARLDRAVGVVLDALERSDFKDNTLFIYTTDHGPAFPDMKCSLTDHGIGVALIMRLPSRFEGGRTTDALVSQVDIFPTLCHLLGIEPPEWLTGESFLPALDGETYTRQEPIFAEVTYHAAYEPKRAVRTDRYKYIRRFDNRTTPVLANCDDSLSKDVWMTEGWSDRPLAREQLYDLVFDPAERRNLVDDSSYRAKLNEMSQRLNKWMVETNDPLLLGEVLPPIGAEYNLPDDVSPQVATHTRQV